MKKKKNIKARSLFLVDVGDVGLVRLLDDDLWMMKERDTRVFLILSW